MSTEPTFRVTAIGRVESPLTDPATAPKQGHEGGAEAWLVFEQDVADGLRDVREGDMLIVLTWLDRAGRDVLRVHPRDDPSIPELGVFSTRPPTAPTRSACTPSVSWRSTASGSGWATSRPWTAPRSST